MPAAILLVAENISSQPGRNAVRDGVVRALDFRGSTTRADFWWLGLALVMLLSLVKLLAQAAGTVPLQIAGLLALLPWVAACTRRLRDAGLSPWWQLISFLPVAGILVLLYLLTYPTREEQPTNASHGDAAKSMDKAA